MGYSLETYSDVLSTINMIAGLKGQEKEATFINAMKSHDLFAKIAKVTVDTAITFGMSKVAQSDDPLPLDLVETLEMVSAEGKGGATKKAKELVSRVASQSPELFQLCQKILRGRLDCGIGEKRMHQLCPGEIPYYPYMRCSGVDRLEDLFDSSGRGEVFSQLKDNGLYLDIIAGNKPGEVYRTRNGNFLKMSFGCEQQIYGTLPYPAVLMGEATLLSECGTFTLPRAQGNAIITQAIHEEMPKAIAERVRIKLWDMVVAEDYSAYKTAIEYGDRVDDLDTWLCEQAEGGLILKHFDLIETRLLSSIQEVFEHFREVRARPVQPGEEQLEGLVVKKPTAIWADGKSKDQVKVKDIKECDLVITGYTPGREGSKYEGLIGSLELQSSCGKVVVNSSGISDADRARDPESLIGLIAAVKFAAVTTNKNKDTFSLDNPRIDEIRSRGDKHQADDLTHIKAQ